MTGFPEYEKERSNRGKLGHFKSMDRSKPKAGPREQDSKKTVMTLNVYLGGLSYSDDENSFYLSSNSVHDTNTKNPLFKVQINGTCLTLMADSGSSVNILDEHHFTVADPDLELSTHVGLRRCTSLNFGISCAAEIF